MRAGWQSLDVDNRTGRSGWAGTSFWKNQIGKGCSEIVHKFCNDLFLVSGFEGLLQNVELLVQLLQLGALQADFAHRVQHGGVIAAAEQFTNLG